MSRFDPDRTCIDCKYHEVFTSRYPCNNCIDNTVDPIYHPMFEPVEVKQTQATVFAFTPGISKGGKQNERLS